MPDILVRNVSPETVAFFKDRAARHRRSLQAEVITALEEVAERESNPHGEFLDWSREFRKRTAGTVQTDSAEIIRAARDGR
jgi:plasmid stability protein